MRSPKNTSGPVFRATTPLSRGQLKSKGHGKLSIHFAAVQETIETFALIVSANQLSLYGAVAEMCEEYESLPERMGRPDMVMGSQSCSVPSRQKFLWKVMTQQIKIFYWNNMENELKSCHNKINGSRETQKLDPRWKLRPVVCMVNMETRLEFGL